jgi:hypothetical protein
MTINKGIMTLAKGTKFVPKALLVIVIPLKVKVLQIMVKVSLSGAKGKHLSHSQIKQHTIVNTHQHTNSY